MTRKKSSVRQQELRFNVRGGKRRGAGRKPKGERSLVPHAARPELARHHPVHVTTHLIDDLPNLRLARTIAAIEQALARAAERHGLRVIHYSIQSNHLHFIVEADDRHALSRGMQGLLVRLARTLNSLWGRKGPVFADRYFARALDCPKVVRIALVYVLQNAARHGAARPGFDPASSSAWFDGWAVPRAPPSRAAPVVPARTWLLTKGWRMYGPIGLDEIPAESNN